MVMQNAVLTKIAQLKPGRKEDLLLVKGFGEAKVARFGDSILEIVREFNAANVD